MNLTYVSFKDGINFIAPLGSFSILPDHFWDLTNYRPAKLNEINLTKVLTKYRK